MEELQAFTNSFTTHRNRAPVEDFHGLSADQMSAFLYAPFTSPEVVTFPAPVSGTPSAPLLTLFLALAEATGERGIKCTATGNLPPALCRQAAAALAAAGFAREAEILGIHNEMDFMELHVARMVAKAAGLLRHYRGRVLLTREGQALWKKEAPGALYPKLLRAHVQRYNWGYADGHARLPFIQQSFLFTLYLLQRHGAEERPADFYAQAYLRAFPMLVDEVEPGPYSPPEDQVRRCYVLRTLQRFAEFLGLITTHGEYPARMRGDCTVRKTPLLDAAVRFHL